MRLDQSHTQSLEEAKTITFDESENVARLIDIDYRKRKTKDREIAEIILYLRGRDGVRRRISIQDFLPYFYANTSVEKARLLQRKHRLFSDWYVKAEMVSKYRYEGSERVKICRIVGKHPWAIPQIRQIFDQQGIETFEADIPFTHRFLLDTGLFCLQGIRIQNGIPSRQGLRRTSHLSPVDLTTHPPMIASLDIEIDADADPDIDSESLASIIREAKRRITAISFCYGRTEEERKEKIFVLQKDSDDEERQILKQAFKFLWKNIDPDVLITFNGDRFDFPYLIERIKNLGLRPSLMTPFMDRFPRKPEYGHGWLIPGVLAFDIIRKSSHIHTEDGSKSLNSIAQAILGEGKLELFTTHGESWRKGLTNADALDLFAKYALKDAELTYRLWFRLGLPEWLEVIRITGAPAGEAMYYTARQAGEFLLFRVMHESNILIPASPGVKGRKERLEDHQIAKGGLVFSPKKEIATGVVICDFTSMYPSIIIAHNVGAESFTKPNAKDPRERFAKYPRTTMALMQEMIFSKRVQVKNQLQDALENQADESVIRALQAYSTALKIVANSTFGSYNFIGSRLYNSQIAATITEIGRLYLSELREKTTEFGEGYETIYGDTDSVFIETPLKREIEALWETAPHSRDEVVSRIPQISELVEFLRKELPEQMRLELQDVAFRILFHKGAKKRYTYASVLTKQIVIVGFEAIRSDWSLFSREAQKKAIELVLKTGDLEFARNEMRRFIAQILKFDEEQIRHQLVLLGPIKKPPSEYEIIPPAVGAFIHYCKQKNIDPEHAWKEFSYFPFVVIEGKGNIRDRARHPDLVNLKRVDRHYYMLEAIRAVNRFNLNLSLDEVLGEYKVRLDDFL